MVIPAMPASLMNGAGSKAREGSRDTDEGIIVSVEPDMCWTPMGGSMVAVPYRIWARQQDVAAMANTVRQTSMRTHVKESLVLRCYGDEPGIGGGVISGTTGATCTPKTYSMTVFAEGRNVARHDDDWWMNNRNTFGKLYYIDDQKSYEEPHPKTLESFLSSPKDSANLYQADVVGPLGDFLPYVEPYVRPLVEPRPPVTPGPEVTPTPPTPGTSPAPTTPGITPEPPAPTPIDPPPGRIKPGPGTGPVDVTPHIQPDPSNTNRTTGKCQKLTICFKNPLGYDVNEYNSQLELQQSRLNQQDPCTTAARIAAYQDRSQYKKIRDQGDAAARKFKNTQRGPKVPYPGGNAALHELDIAAGGDPTVIARWGDSLINSYIGPEWARIPDGGSKERRDCLKDYASAVCDSSGKCHMVVTLKIGSCDCTLSSIGLSTQPTNPPSSTPQQIPTPPSGPPPSRSPPWMPGLPPPEA